MEKWRCIMSGIGDPYENMAVDEALLESTCHSGVPVLRFYGWSPAAVSLGFAQRCAEALNMEEIRRRHMAWVRRPTGGRAVLHDMEVTYSVAIPAAHPLYGIGLAASYERLCQPILAALRSLGVDAALSPHASSGFVSASCFTAPGTTDILAHHRKIVGSAQMRTHDGFLQHGSIILKGDLGKLFAVVRTKGQSPEQAAHLAARLTTSVDQEAGRCVVFSEAVQAMRIAFGNSDTVDLLDDMLTNAEQQRAIVICRQKYASEAWNALR